MVQLSEFFIFETTSCCPWGLWLLLHDLNDLDLRHLRGPMEVVPSPTNAKQHQRVVVGYTFYLLSSSGLTTNCGYLWVEDGGTSGLLVALAVLICYY